MRTIRSTGDGPSKCIAKLKLGATGRRRTVRVPNIEAHSAEWQSGSSSKNWTIANPKPIGAVAVRNDDIIVRSKARWMRTQPKWLSEVVLTSNLSGPDAVRDSDMPVASLVNSLARRCGVCAAGMRCLVSSLGRRPPQDLENPQAVNHHLYSQRSLQHGQHPPDDDQQAGQVVSQKCFGIPQCHEIQHHNHKQEPDNHGLVDQIVSIK